MDDIEIGDKQNGYLRIQASRGKKERIIPLNTKATGPVHRLVIIDEAQRVKNIGLKLKLIVDNFPDIQIIATGSSSFDLANEIEEPLTGRNIEFWLFSLGLDELFSNNQVMEADRQLENLLIYGSYPDVYQPQTIDLKTQRVKNLAIN